MRVKIVSGVVALALLAGCTPPLPPQQPPPPPRPPGENAALRCARAADLVGARIGQPWGAVQTELAGPLRGVNIRALTPGMAATMDFNPARLTVQLSHQHRVLSVACT